MTLKSITLTLFCAGIFSQPVFADDLAELKAKLNAMQQQMQVMQNKLDDQEAVLKKQAKASTELQHQQANRNKDKEARAVAQQVADSLSIGGVIEVVANNTNSDGWLSETTSDIVLDTFELSVEASANEWVMGSVLFLYEDASDDNLNVDEAFISIANSDVTPFYLSAGRLYVPFGNFETNMISDPVTLTLGETREDVIQVGFETEGGFYGSAYVFNGDADEAKGNYSSLENNKIDNYGLNFGYAMQNNSFSLDVGAGYINNIATSDTLQNAVGDNALCADDGCLDDYVGGMSLHAIATFGQFSLIGEYITAMDDFEANEISSVNTDKLKPRAWNLEGAYNFEMAGKETTIALGYQKTKDMYFESETTDYFEKAWLASISVGILENTTLAAEWRHADGYSEVKNAVDNDFEDEDLMQVKLSYEF